MASPTKALEYGGTTLTTTIATTVESHPEANGLALILCNDYITTRPSFNLTQLPGAITDGRKMKSSFTKLNYATLLECNLSMQGVVDILREIARHNCYPRTYRRIVVVFSGHGTSGQQLYANDGKTFIIRDMVTILSPKQAPHLGSTPKLFFIDACRGNLKDQGIYIPKGEVVVPEEVPVPKGGHVLDSIRVPSEGNCLVAYSTLPEHLSFECTSEGGMWMSCLARKIVTINKTVTDILIDVNQELIEKFNYGLKENQQPEYISQLNELVNFFAEANLEENIHSSEANVSSCHDRIRHPTLSTVTVNARYSQPPVIIPAQNCINFQESLKQFCSKEGKPMPSYKILKPPRAFEAQVYVAKTRGWTPGEQASSQNQAKENAAKALIDQLPQDVISPHIVYYK